MNQVHLIFHKSHLKELIKNVLQSKSSSFRKGFFSDIVKPLMGDGLLTSEGEMWKLHHRLANAGFQVNLNYLFPLIIPALPIQRHTSCISRSRFCVIRKMGKKLQVSSFRYL
jgi:hypothetical protein